MSSMLFFLVPVGLLAVVWSVCFVGCTLPTSGLPDSYSNIILQEPSLVAYWPLNDPAGATPTPPPLNSTGVGTAVDLTGKGHNGSYLEPPGYPPPTAALPSMQIASPTLRLRQTSMLPGDGVISGSKNLNPACVNFNGGYVNIPWAANSPPLTDFTLEAWINPNLPATGLDWVIFDALTSTTGFALFINTNNNWGFAFGNGTQLQQIDTMVPVALGAGPIYVALTFKSATQVLSVWVNPDSDTSAPPSPVWPPSSPNPTQTNYVAIDSTQPATFFIGAGDTQDPTLRTVAMSTGAPLFPFVGLIQSVALYSAALDPTDLASHYAGGTESDNTDT